MNIRRTPIDVGTKEDPNLLVIQEFFEDTVRHYDHLDMEVTRMPKLVKRNPLEKAYTIGGEGEIVIGNHTYELIPVGFFPGDKTGGEQQGFTRKSIKKVSPFLQKEFGICLEDLTWGDVPRNKIFIEKEGAPEARVVRPVEVLLPLGFVMHDYTNFGTNVLLGTGLENGTLTYIGDWGGLHFRPQRQFVPEITTKPVRCNKGILMQKFSPHVMQSAGTAFQIGAFVSAESGTPRGDALEFIAKDPYIRAEAART
jgi:hypothetical protein